MTEKMGELVAALVKARAQLKGTVFKAGRNDAQRFAYVGHEHVLVSGAREALLSCGLVLVQTGVEYAGESVYKTSKGEATCWRWRGSFVLAHTSGAQMILSFEATTQANDKAGYVASTALDRTAHLRVLELAGSSEEDPEHDPGAQQQPQVSGDLFGDMLADLEQRSAPEALTQWARDLAVLKARADQKKPLWDAFGARCKGLGHDPATLAANARKAA
jgi:hypothetical protein